MTITTRAGKGSPLTVEELDGNFTDLDGRMQELEEATPEALPPTNMTVVGSQWTIYYGELSFGPFTLPRAPFVPSAVATVAGTTRELALTDANGYLVCSNPAGCTVTLPAQADVAWLANTEITFEQAGVGAVTVEWPTDVTVNYPQSRSPATLEQYAVITLKRFAEDEWTLIGAMAEAVTA